MARKKISELTSLASASLDTVVVGVDNGVTYKIELDILADGVKDRINTLDAVRLNNLQTFSASTLTRLDELEFQNSELNSFTQSQNASNTAFTNAINSRLQTASFNEFSTSTLTRLDELEMQISQSAEQEKITNIINFTESGSIQSISASSGDGNGYSTLTLTPDTTLGSDQYIILDPTGPNHIHIRPGGTIDNSGADLYIGGEKNYVRVSDSSPSVRMQTESTRTINSYYFSPGFGAASIEWYTQNGNHYVRFNDPTMDVYNAIWAFNDPSTFQASYNGGNDYISFTVNGSSTPGFPQSPSFYVAEAPPSSPTYLDTVDIQILQNRESYVSIQNRDININADDDLRLYSRDTFSLRNYSDTSPIEIVANYDNNDKIFAFNPDGTLTFPDSTIQTTAFTGLPTDIISSSAQISALGFTSQSADVSALNSFTQSQNAANTAFTNGINSRLQTSSFNDFSSSVDTRINSITLSSGSNLTYLLEAYANDTYTLPGGFTEDPCRYSVVSVNENVPSNWFNTSTYRFTPQKAGYWEINAAYDVYRNSEASMAIRKNGSIVASAGSFNAVAQQVIKIVYLNGSTDYIDIVNTGGGTLQRYQYQQRSWFQAKWIGE